MVDTGLPERSEAPVAHLIVHPGEDFVMTSLKDLVVGDVQIIPVCRVHRLVKRLSTDALSYAKLTHAMWNSIHGSGWGSQALYSDLTGEKDASEVAQTILDVQEMLGTALAKHKSIAMTGTPGTAIRLMRLGYRVQARLKTVEGIPLPICPEASGYISSLMALKGDPFTAWRQFAPIWHTIQDREVNLDTLPKWLIYSAEQT